MPTTSCTLVFGWQEVSEVLSNPQIEGASLTIRGSQPVDESLVERQISCPGLREGEVTGPRSPGDIATQLSDPSGMCRNVSNLQVRPNVSIQSRDRPTHEEDGLHTRGLFDFVHSGLHNSWKSVHEA